MSNLLMKWANLDLRLLLKFANLGPPFPLPLFPFILRNLLKNLVKS